MLTGLFSLLVLGAVVFIGLCMFLFIGQESFIFFPRPNDPQLVQRQQASRVEIASDGATLEGWWIENPQTPRQATRPTASPTTILYFGGNAEDVLYTAATASSIDARQMLVVNYRGYGRSTGKPAQKALYDDAFAIYQHAIDRGVRPEDIVVMGRSLGSGVAAMLAATRPVRAAILITPFDSLAAVAGKHYPIFPVRLLLRHPFPSSEWAQQAQAPALILAAQNDYIVPSIHAQRLYDAWAGPKQIDVLAGVGHNDIEMHPDYDRLINEFLAAPASASQSARPLN